MPPGLVPRLLHSRARRPTFPQLWHRSGPMRVTCLSPPFAPVWGLAFLSSPASFRACLCVSASWLASSLLLGSSPAPRAGHLVTVCSGTAPSPACPSPAPHCRSPSSTFELGPVASLIALDGSRQSSLWPS